MTRTHLFACTLRLFLLPLLILIAHHCVAKLLEFFFVEGVSVIWHFLQTQNVTVGLLKFRQNAPSAVVTVVGRIVGLQMRRPLGKQIVSKHVVAHHLEPNLFASWLILPDNFFRPFDQK